jgi:cephalosporin-C deacetylase-like acetyl esterase
MLLPILVADDKADLVAQLRKLDTNVFTPEAAKEKQLDRMVERDIRSRIHASHQREADAFAKIQTRAEWEKFRDVRIKALRESLGPLPLGELGKDLKVRVARTFKGEGYVREDLTYESRPGLVVTANLYRPATKPPSAMPGIILVHGFHQPKTQGELQDMGVTWGKLDCVVLVMDVIGHGERRQHPFLDASTYPGKFNVPRQDYYGRANTGVQLSIAGESLMGWMAFDVMRGVDLLLGRPGIDKDKIIVLGAVAAGGDVAAIAAALDPRITAVVPFNFGGPEPETDYPLPAKDAELRFPYAAGGHWDSTRRLRNSARDGFLPWVVIGSVAPRRLIYAHEFAWDKAHDPVWPRLEKIYGLYDAKDNLAFAHGSGTLFGMPEGTGCANIGAVHRKEIYPTFKRWFDMPPPDKEVQDRKPANEMLCVIKEKNVGSRPVYQLASSLAQEQLLGAQARLAKQKLPERVQTLRRDWAKILGDIEPKGEPKISVTKQEKLGTVERIAMEVEPGIMVPLILLLPSRKGGERVPVVVGVAQHGKQEFLRERSDAIAELLQGGVAVCLADIRGAGETRCDGDLRGPPAGSYKGVEKSSRGTLLATEDQMLGRTLLGDRLRDLRYVLRYLRSRPELDGTRLALWGESFTPINATEARMDVPWDAEKLPTQAEPLGGLLALLAALFEDYIRAVYINGGLVNYMTLLDSQFCYVPQDVIVPGAVSVGDLPQLIAALASRPVRLQNLVDGRNRKMLPDIAAKSLEPALQTYRAERAADRLMIDGKESAAAWLLAQLKK